MAVIKLGEVRWANVSDSGCLQIQPNKFPGAFQDTFNKLPVR